MGGSSEGAAGQDSLEAGCRSARRGGGSPPSASRNRTEPQVWDKTLPQAEGRLTLRVCKEDDAEEDVCVCVCVLGFPNEEVEED